MDRIAATDLTKPGWIIVVSMAALTMVGVASIYVTDTHYSGTHDGPANAAKQCVAGLIVTMRSGPTTAHEEGECEP